MLTGSYICINPFFLDLADMYNYIKMVLAQHWVQFNFILLLMNEKPIYSASPSQNVYCKAEKKLEILLLF